MVNNVLFLLLLAVTAVVFGMAVAWLWKSRKIKQLSTTLDQLKSSFSYLEAEHNKAILYINEIQKAKDNLIQSRTQQVQIIRSLRLNINQLEKDRQNIINAFNTYKEQTVDQMKTELDRTKTTNEALRLKYEELIALQERNYAMVIDLAQRQEAKILRQ